MQVTDIIVILLFIIPGVLAEKISYSMDMPTSEKRSEFRELVNGVLLSLPIIVFVGTIMCPAYQIGTLAALSTAFNNIVFLLIFSVAVGLAAVALGIVKGLSSDKVSGIINKIREKKGKINIDNKSCWRKLFLDKDDYHYVEIIHGSEKLSGFTKWYSLPNEDKEIVLFEPDFLAGHPEYKEKFTKVIYTYVNIEKNIVILDYDISEYEKWIDTL